MGLGKKQVLSMSKKNSNIQNQVILALLLGFLGLSPIGEPHLIGKLKWIEGGAIGMKPIDWFDFVMHGGSALISLVLLVWIIYSLITKPKS